MATINVTFPRYRYILLLLLFLLLLLLLSLHSYIFLTRVTEKSSVLPNTIPNQSLKIGHCRIQVLCSSPSEAIHWATLTRFRVQFQFATLVTAHEELPSFDVICTEIIYSLFLCANRVLLWDRHFSKSTYMPVTSKTALLFNYVSNLFIKASIRSEKLISCGPYRL